MDLGVNRAMVAITSHQRRDGGRRGPVRHGDDGRQAALGPRADTAGHRQVLTAHASYRGAARGCQARTATLQAGLSSNGAELEAAGHLNDRGAPSTPRSAASGTTGGAV